MTTRNVLFISGSIGLGHVTRDLAIATALRAHQPDVRLVWLAGDPARQALQAAGEELVPECERYADETAFVETIAGRFSLRLLNPAVMFTSPRRIKAWWRMLRGQRANVAIFKEVTARQRFDLIVADEAYELALALMVNPSLKRAPCAAICDFVGFDATSRNPLEWLAVQNVSWWSARLAKRFTRIFDLTLMVGEEADVADKPFGLFSPNRREIARSMLKCVGYVCPFTPGDYQDRVALRQRLGYGPEPLVVCAIGGTSIGKALLELCGRAYPRIRRHLPDLRMELVCGPRLSPDLLDVPAGVGRRGYVHALYEHLAACDLAIVQGGGTTTTELMVLRRPFLYFPLEGHFEQRVHVAGRLARHGAGVQLEYGKTTPERLADVVMANIGREVRYPPIAADGAKNAAELLCSLM
jgi:predicted glycosyltransferase